MPLIVLPATIPDIPAIYDVYFAAFDSHLITQILFPQGTTSQEFRTAHSASTLQWWHTACLQHTFKCIDTTTGEIVGMATWDICWRERTDQERQRPVVEWLEGEERKRAEAFLTPFWEMKEKFLGRRRHVYCQVVAVHPEHQRRGVGRLLMDWGVDVAEKMSVPVYLEATLEGVPLYEKMGFERLSEGPVIKPEVSHWKSEVVAPLMVKMPASGGKGFDEWAMNGDYEGHLKN